MSAIKSTVEKLVSDKQQGGSAGTAAIDTPAATIDTHPMGTAASVQKPEATAVITLTIEERKEFQEFRDKIRYGENIRGLIPKAPIPNWLRVEKNLIEILSLIAEKKLLEDFIEIVNNILTAEYKLDHDNSQIMAYHQPIDLIPILQKQDVAFFEKCGNYLLVSAIKRGRTDIIKLLVVEKNISPNSIEFRDFDPSDTPIYMLVDPAAEFFKDIKDVLELITLFNEKGCSLDKPLNVLFINIIDSPRQAIICERLLALGANPLVPYRVRRNEGAARIEEIRFILDDVENSLKELRDYPDFKENGIAKGRFYAAITARNLLISYGAGLSVSRTRTGIMMKPFSRFGTEEVAAKISVDRPATTAAGMVIATNAKIAAGTGMVKTAGSGGAAAAIDAAGNNIGTNTTVAAGTWISTIAGSAAAEATGMAVVDDQNIKSVQVLAKELAHAVEFTNEEQLKLRLIMESVFATQEELLVPGVRYVFQKCYKDYGNCLNAYLGEIGKFLPSNKEQPLAQIVLSFMAPNININKANVPVKALPPPLNEAESIEAAPAPALQPKFLNRRPELLNRRASH